MCVLRISQRVNEEGVSQKNTTTGVVLVFFIRLLLRYHERENSCSRCTNVSGSIDSARMFFSSPNVSYSRSIRLTASGLFFPPAKVTRTPRNTFLRWQKISRTNVWNRGRSEICARRCSSRSNRTIAESILGRGQNAAGGRTRIILTPALANQSKWKARCKNDGQLKQSCDQPFRIEQLQWQKKRASLARDLR